MATRALFGTGGGGELLDDDALGRAARLDRGLRLIFRAKQRGAVAGVPGLGQPGEVLRRRPGELLDRRTEEGCLAERGFALHALGLQPAPKGISPPRTTLARLLEVGHFR